MFDILTYSIDKIQLFFLILIRISGLFIIAPVFSNQALPKMAKVAATLMFSLLLVTVFKDTVITPAISMIELVGMCFREMLVGVLIGLVFNLIFISVQGAGSLAGYQMGMYIASALDPMTQGESSQIGTFWALLATLVFLAIDGHYLIIQALVTSFQAIPPGMVTMNGTVGDLIIKYSAYIFVIALKIVSPVMVTLFLVDISLGTVAKMMPTMNVFFVGMPVKIVAGLAVMAMSMPIFRYVLEKVTLYLNDELQVLLVAMGKA
ncbi:MAG: flagellar biosynthetic protein FliR [Candidatus Zixiibacteriota bacterium]